MAEVYDNYQTVTKDAEEHLVDAVTSVEAAYAVMLQGTRHGVVALPDTHRKRLRIQLIRVMAEAWAVKEALKQLTEDESS